MGIRNLSVKLAKTFNWLAEPPKNQMTLGEFVPWATGGVIELPGSPRQMSRVARVVERGIFGIGVVAAVAAAVAEGQGAGGFSSGMLSAAGPLLTIPILFKGMSYSMGLLTDRVIHGLANKANDIEAHTRRKEFKAQNRQDLPRRMR